MGEDETKLGDSTYAVFAELEGYEKPLIMTEMTFGRLLDEIVIPYQERRPFFVDGAPVDLAKLCRLKIIREREFLRETLHDLHYGMRWGDLKTQDLYARQYHVRLEALLRESGEDVTAQVVKAYNTAIKPKVKSWQDYLPNRGELIEAAAKVFWEALKTLGS